MYLMPPNLEGCLLAVMDGHRGSAVAEICAREIEKLFAPKDSEHVEQALRDLVVALNELTYNLEAGSTLSLACVFKDVGDHMKVSTAVLGDSPVVVLDNQGELHISPEHNVRSNLPEREAAERRGGVYKDGYLRNREGTAG